MVKPTIVHSPTHAHTASTQLYRALPINMNGQQMETNIFDIYIEHSKPKTGENNLGETETAGAGKMEKKVNKQNSCPH